MLMDRFHPD